MAYCLIYQVKQPEIISEHVTSAPLHGFGVTIIGAGVVGLSIAARVARKSRKTLILERNGSFGHETSSRNSGVVHAGLYYPEDSLKARLCVEGNAALYQLCRKYGIPFQNLGKLVVATEEAEVSQLHVLLEQGRMNGVEGLKLLSRGELRQLEPNIAGTAALFSSTTGIIDAYALMSFFLQQAKDGGAILVCNSEVIGVQPTSHGYEVTIRDREGLTSFITATLVNCAGLSSDKIAQLVGIDIDRAGYRLHYCKGEYFILPPSKQGLVTHLVYPVPEPRGAGLGIHVTLDLEGRIRLGPNAEYVDDIDYRVDENYKQRFYDSPRRLLPQLQCDELQPDFAGIRPKLQGPGDGFRDFIIRQEADRGLPGLVNLIGIESPGLTASPAIGRYVGDIIAQCL